MNGFTDLWYDSYLFSFSEVRRQMSFEQYDGKMIDFMRWKFKAPRFAVFYKPCKGFLVRVVEE